MASQGTKMPDAFGRQLLEETVCSLTLVKQSTSACHQDSIRENYDPNEIRNYTNAALSDMSDNPFNWDLKFPQGQLATLGPPANGILNQFYELQMPLAVSR